MTAQDTNIKTANFKNILRITFICNPPSPDAKPPRPKNKTHTRGHNTRKKPYSTEPTSHVFTNVVRTVFHSSGMRSLHLRRRGIGMP